MWLSRLCSGMFRNLINKIELGLFYAADGPFGLHPPIAFQQRRVIAHELEAIEELVSLGCAVNNLGTLLIQTATAEQII